MAFICLVVRHSDQGYYCYKTFSRISDRVQQFKVWAPDRYIFICIYIIKKKSFHQQDYYRLYLVVKWCHFNPDLTCPYNQMNTASSLWRMLFYARWINFFIQILLFQVDWWARIIQTVYLLVSVSGIQSVYNNREKWDKTRCLLSNLFLFVSSVFISFCLFNSLDF